MWDYGDHPSLYSTQVDGETFAQLFEESQVQWDPTQCIKNTEHLTRHCTGGQIAIACGSKEDLSFRDADSQKRTVKTINVSQGTPIVVTTVPAKKKELLKSQLLGLVELPEGFTPFSQASKITCTNTQKNTT